jgi:hypothetical protein
MASDELRLLVTVPENHYPGALPQLRRHKESFSSVPTALRPSRPLQHWVFHQAEKELTTLPVPRYGSGHRKRWFKNPIHTS